MSPIDTILCAVDFSTASRNAAREAIRFAGHLRAKTLLFVHAVELESQSTSDGPVEETEEGASSEASARLDSWTSELSSSIPITQLVVVGTAVEAILAAATARRAHLLVVGTTGRTGLRRVVMGSVAEGIVRKSETPVLVIREPRSQ